jgi:cardiolipin synthase A/B
MPNASYQWHAGNAFELYENGPAFFPRMIERINQARHSIDLEIYLFEPGANARYFLAALERAVDRGVAVRLMVDGLGSKAFLKQNRVALRDSAIRLKVFNPLSVFALKKRLHRDHRKLLIIDRQEMFTGGAGITDQFFNPEKGSFDWREVMVWSRGPVVADALDLFERLWADDLTTTITEQPASAGPAEDADGYGLISFVSNDHDALVQRTRHWLEGARNRLWFITPYFLPRIEACRRLAGAAERGVDVRLYLPGTNTDHASVRLAGRSHYEPLLSAGVKIFEGTERFSHAKVLLVDSLLSIGSCNFDFWGLGWNREANLEIQDRNTLEQAERLFADYQDLSRQITLDYWLERSKTQRCMTSAAGIVSRTVERSIRS